MGTMLRKGGLERLVDSANTGGFVRILGLYQHQIERLLKGLSLRLTRLELLS